MPQVLCLKAETYPHKVKTSITTGRDPPRWWQQVCRLYAQGQNQCDNIPSFAQSTEMTDLILIFAFILGVQYSNPFWVHGHVPP